MTGILVGQRNNKIMRRLADARRHKFSELWLVEKIKVLSRIWRLLKARPKLAEAVIKF